MKTENNAMGYTTYVWTTPDRYEITQSQVDDIRDIVKEATGKQLNINDVLRMVDIFKSFANNDFPV